MHRCDFKVPCAIRKRLKSHSSTSSILLALRAADGFANVLSRSAEFVSVVLVRLVQGDSVGFDDMRPFCPLAAKRGPARRRQAVLSL